MEYISGTPVCLPDKVRIALFQNPDLGVGVVFKDSKYKIWSVASYRDSKFTKQSISRMVLSGKFNDFAKDFVIVNKQGENCSANFDAKTSIDDNGYIHINDNAFLIKVIEDKNNPIYVGGKTVEAIEKQVREYVDKGVIKKPADFGPNGFSKKPIFEVSQPGMN